MPADEHVRRSFDALAERLRDDISRHLDAIGGELAGSLTSEHAEALAAADEERVRALAQAAEEHEEAIERVQQASREDAWREAAERHATTLAEAEANAREEGLREGRAVGLEEGRREGEAAASEAIEAAHAAAVDAARGRREADNLAASERLVEAIRLMDRGKSLSEILDTLVSCAGREAARVGVLLVRGNHLRGWRFIGFGPALDERTDLETPMADAGIISDAVRTGAAVSGDSAANASAPAFAALPPGRETFALPVPVSGQIVAVLYADQGDREIGGGLVTWPAALEVMTRHAARSLEAITAFRAAQVLTERPDVPAAAGGDNARGPERAAPQVRVAPADHAEEEQSARRYARLLISEIKLYHEPAVIAGRREGNLTERLGGEIARAKVLYEQRVPAAIRQGGDYFHEELVRTLADGNEALLARS